MDSERCLTTADTAIRTASLHKTTTDAIVTSEAVIASKFGVVTRTATDALSCPQVANGADADRRATTEKLRLAWRPTECNYLDRVATECW